MYIEIEHQNQFHLPSFSSFAEFVEQLNELLGENSYIIEKNGRKIDLNVEDTIEDEQIYRIWPKILGGKVNKINCEGKRKEFSSIDLGRFWFFIAFFW